MRYDVRTSYCVSYIIFGVRLLHVARFTPMGIPEPLIVGRATKYRLFTLFFYLIHSQRGRAEGTQTTRSHGTIFFQTASRTKRRTSTRYAWQESQNYEKRRHSDLRQNRQHSRRLQSSKPRLRLRHGRRNTGRFPKHNGTGNLIRHKTEHQSQAF